MCRISFLFFWLFVLYIFGKILRKHCREPIASYSSSRSNCVFLSFLRTKLNLKSIKCSNRYLLTNVVPCSTFLGLFIHQISSRNIVSNKYNNENLSSRKLTFLLSTRLARLFTGKPFIFIQQYFNVLTFVKIGNISTRYIVFLKDTENLGIFRANFINTQYEKSYV